MSVSNPDFRDALPVGTVVGEYEVEALLGYGGYGLVYRARHVELGHVVALKEYLPADLAVRDDGTVFPRSTESAPHFEDGRRRFLEEAKRIVQFNDDPGVVRCLGFFRENGTAYLVMEFVDGRSLAELLKQRETAGRAFDEGDLKLVAVPLLETLSRLHRAGILHRDIKPSNILIRRCDEQPILIDFGAAKQMTADYSKSAAPYTEGYAALEQVGEGELGPQTDVYAFGAVMWRMIAGGNPPWDPPNPKRVELRAAAVLDGKPDPLPSATELGAGRFSGKLLLAIDKSLTVSPDKRPGDIKHLQIVLEGESKGLPEPPSVYVHEQGPSQKFWQGRAILIAPAMIMGALLVLGVEWLADGPTANQTGRPESSVSTNEHDRRRTVSVERLPSSSVPQASSGVSDSRTRIPVERPPSSSVPSLPAPVPASVFTNCGKIKVNTRTSNSYLEKEFRDLAETRLQSAGLLLENPQITSTRTLSLDRGLFIHDFDGADTQIYFGPLFRKNHTLETVNDKVGLIYSENEWRIYAKDDRESKKAFTVILDHIIDQYLGLNRNACSDSSVDIQDRQINNAPFANCKESFTVTVSAREKVHAQEPYLEERIRVLTEEHLRSSGLSFFATSSTLAAFLSSSSLTVYINIDEVSSFRMRVEFSEVNPPLIITGGSSSRDSDKIWSDMAWDVRELDSQNLEPFIAIIINNFIKEYISMKQHTCPESDYFKSL